MKFSAVFFSIALFAATSQASVLRVRQAAATGCTCGHNTYSADDVSAALSQAENGGGASYPHQYKDLEGFDFSATCQPSFNEYPLIVGSVYTGGPPGPDRLIFDDSGDFCACITHTGASGNAFVACN